MGGCGIEDEPPNEDQMAQMRQTFQDHIAENGSDKFEAEDVHRVMTDDNYLGRFFKHVYDEPGDQIELSTNMIVNSLQWRKSMDVKGMTCETVKDSIKSRGNLYVHNVDCDGKSLLVFAVKNHKRGEELMDDMKRFFLYYLERLDRSTGGDKMTLVFDCAGCGLKNMDMELIQYMIGVYKDYYPDVLNYILVFEMPWVLNAAWKVIKSWLPAAAVKKIKFLTKSNLSEFVKPDQALVAWGGTDDWEYSFEEEPPRMSNTERPNSLPLSTPNENHVDAASEVDSRQSPGAAAASKAVRFDSANESFDSAANDTSFASGDKSKNRASSTVTSSAGFSDAQSPGASFNAGPIVRDILSLNPSSEVLFEVNAATNSLVAKVKITNTSAKIVVFKIKTTSPDKYRVRPSLSHIRAGETADVEIHLHPSQLCVEPGAALAEVSDLGTVLTPEASASLLKDKFLITGVTYKPEAEDAPDSSGEDPLGHNKLTELMKTTTPEVQCRLKCGLSGLSKASSQMIRNAAAVAGVGEKMPTTSTLQNANKQLETLTRKVSSMQVSVSELQESLASFKKVCAAMVLCMMLTQMMLLYYVSAISSNNTATANDQLQSLEDGSNLDAGMSASSTSAMEGGGHQEL